MTTTFADTQGHALGLNAPSVGATHRSQRAMLTAGLFAGLLLVGGMIVTVAPMVDLTATSATAAGSTTLSDHRVGEIGAGQVAISSAEGLRAFRAEEIALGSVPAPVRTIPFAKAHAAPVDLTAATTPLADQGYRDQRAGEIGVSSGGASGKSPGRSSGK